MPLVNGLPDFMRFSPERESVQIIETETDYYPADDPTARFERPSEVYDHIEHSNREAVFPENGFSRFEYLGEGEEPRDNDGGRNGLFFEDNMRLLINHTEGREERSAHDWYGAWLLIAAEYRAQPTDFYRSYKFVNNHPLFWSYNVMSRGDIFWDYNGFSQIANPLSVYRHDGEVTFLIEPTFKEGHLSSDKSPNVLDTNLVVSDISYEGAIIKLAARLDEHYDDTGTQRENVPDTEYTARLMAKLDPAAAGESRPTARRS